MPPMSKKKVYGPDIYKRNEHGLLENIDYTFNEDGSVDWRSMVKDEFLYPNKGWFEARKKDVPKSIDGLKDNHLLIMLGETFPLMCCEQQPSEWRALIRWHLEDRFR